MNEPIVLDIIRAEFRLARLPLPDGLALVRRGQGQDSDQHRVCWQRIARAIVTQADGDMRAAARLSSQVGAAITRGRTRI